MNLYFTYESRATLKSFSLFITVKAITKLNLGNLRSSRSPADNAEFGHFTLLFCRERQRNVPRIITHVPPQSQLFCSLNLLFTNVPVAFAFVISLNSLVVFHRSGVSSRSNKHSIPGNPGNCQRGNSQGN